MIEEFDVIGIDMPIGLPHTGSRSCDIEARRFLAPRGSTIFPAPPRSLIHHTKYAEANSASRADHGRGLSRQTFGLFAKIREVDILAQRHPDQLVEVHPECAFTQMAGRVLAPKRSTAGRADRLALVEKRFGAVDERRPGAAPDDILDAYAVLWSTDRFMRGEHTEFGSGQRDATGLPMRIVS